MRVPNELYSNGLFGPVSTVYSTCCQLISIPSGSGSPSSPTRLCRGRTASRRLSPLCPLLCSASWWLLLPSTGSPTVQ